MNEEQKKNGLPEGWKWVKLGEVCTKMSNGANAKQIDENVGLPISRIETIWNESIDWNRVKYIQENEKEFIEKYALKENDILFSHINSDIHLGKTAIYKNQNQILIHGINLLLIRLNEDVIADFFNYQFKYKRKKGEFSSIAQKSVNQSSINQPKLKGIDFVLPPKPIQQAIISKIEELFSELDKSIETLRLAQQQLKTYRQAVLKWAFEGRFSNENVNRQLPLGWQVKPLGQISESCLGKMLDKQKNKGLLKPYLRNISVRWGSFDLQDLEQMKFEESELERYSLKKGDLVICEGGEPGRCAVWNHENNTMMIQKALHRVRVNSETSEKYLYYFIRFISLNGSIQEYFTGTTIKHLTGKELKKIKVPFTSIGEQNKIVSEIEARFSVADKIGESVAQALQQAEVLRQSILKKVFEGKI